MRNNKITVFMRNNSKYISFPAQYLLLPLVECLNEVPERVRCTYITIYIALYIYI